MKVTWAPRAEKRALEAVDYIAKQRPQAAVARLEELSETPATDSRRALEELQTYV